MAFISNFRLAVGRDRSILDCHNKMVRMSNKKPKRMPRHFEREEPEFSLMELLMLRNNLSLHLPRSRTFLFGAWADCFIRSKLSVLDLENKKHVECKQQLYEINWVVVIKRSLYISFSYHLCLFCSSPNSSDILAKMVFATVKNSPTDCHMAL